MDKNKIMMIIIIALLVVLLGSIVGVFFMFKGYVNANAQQGNNEPMVEFADVKYSEQTLISIPSISTNLATSADGIPHTAKVDLAYSVVNNQEESAELITLLNEKQLVVQSIALETIRSKTYEEMMRTDSQQMLEEEILKKLQDTFETNLIYSVVVYNIIAV